MNCPLGNHRQKVRLNMKINGITSHNFSSQKQISFGIIEDKTAARIIEENAQNECTLPILNSSKFFIFSSEGQKLKVKLNEEFLRERTTDDMVEDEYIEEVKSSSDKLPELYPVGLALGTYIICENEKGIYLIDQHAAQERINYEKYSYYLSHPSDNTIESIVPIVIDLPTDEFLMVKKNIDIIRDLNIEIEEFGTSSYRVTSHPTWFPRNNPDKVLRNIIDQVISKEKDFNLAKFHDHLAATMACKASVKGNTRITIHDMESLISQLRHCDNPFNCPHGRPTIIEFTIYEIEKMFKRSI